MRSQVSVTVAAVLFVLSPIAAGMSVMFSAGDADPTTDVLLVVPATTVPATTEGVGAGVADADVSGVGRREFLDPSGGLRFSRTLPGGTMATAVSDDFLARKPRTLPEPATLILLGSGLIGFAVLAWRSRRRR
jgi:PEP-CTERM motif-containing protein